MDSNLFYFMFIILGLVHKNVVPCKRLRSKAKTGICTLFSANHELSFECDFSPW